MGIFGKLKGIFRKKEDIDIPPIEGIERTLTCNVIEFEQ